MMTGLIYAVKENDLNLANILINHNCNVNIKDYYNRNALFYAINSSSSGSNDNLDIIKMLISNDILINEEDSEGYSPLSMAVIKGIKEVVTCLVNNGADVDYKSILDGNTPLHYAVINNKPDLIYILLSKKPNLSIKNKNEQTPLDIAFNLSSTECYQILAEDFHQRGLAIRRKEEVNLSNQGLSNTHATNISANDNSGNNLTNNSQNSNDILIEEQILKDDEDSNIRNSFNSMNGPSLNNNLSGVNFNNFSNMNQNFSMNKMNVSNANNTFNNNQNYNSLANLTSNNINMNNIQNSLNRNGNNCTQKNNRNMKHNQKLQVMQKRRLNSGQSDYLIKDKIFEFSVGQNNQNSTNIEIPFNFQTNIEGKLGNNSGKYGRGTQLHTFISKYAFNENRISIHSCFTH
jgi:ankyrin repeat protein